jgi:hypothetical protein
MKKFIVLTFLLSNFAFALPQNSGPFYLTGGTVPPKAQSLAIVLTSLPRTVNLDINCDIENPNYDKPFPVVISAHGSINGVTSPTYQYLLDHQISKFKTQVFISYLPPNGDPSAIYITNYDASDAVQVKNCIVTYTT